MIAVANKEEARATEALLALGCVEAAKLPWYVWKRTVAKVLRKKRFDFDGPGGRKKKAFNNPSRNLTREEDFKAKVREELGIERLPPGVADRLVVWGVEMQPLIVKRLEYAERELSTVTRERVRWLGIERRVLASLRTCAYEDTLVRNGGGCVFGMRKIEGVVRYVGQQEESAYLHLTVDLSRDQGTNNSSGYLWREDGQVRIIARVSASVRQSWYGRVYKRGLAVVDGCFVLDLEGYGAAHDGSIVARVRAARRGTGFQCKVKSCIVRRHPDGTQHFDDTEEGELEEK